MQITDYIDNFKKFHELNELSFDKDMSDRKFKKQILAITKEKNLLMKKNDEFIAYYIEPYEKDKSLITEEVAENLEKISDTLKEDGNQFDRVLRFRISVLLFKYYLGREQYSKSLKYLYNSAYYELILCQYYDKTVPLEYMKYVDLIMEHYDFLDDTAKNLAVMYFYLSVFDQSDMEHAINRFDKVQTYIESNFIDYKSKDSPNHKYFYYSMGDTICLSLDAMSYHKHKYSPEDMNLLRRIRDRLKEVYDTNEIQVQRAKYTLMLTQCEYFIDGIDLDTCLKKIQDLIINPPSSIGMDLYTYVYLSGASYISMLYRNGNYSKKSRNEMAQVLINQVLKKELTIKDSQDEFFQKNALANFTLSLGKNLGFTYAKDSILKITVLEDPPLYIHSYIVKNISLVLASYILDNDIHYFDGVSDFTYDYLENKRSEAYSKIIELVKECAMYHDIGKHLCMDFIKTNYRTLTDHEYNVIKMHPVFFDDFFCLEEDSTFNCVRDVALTHHRWYNEKGGYPEIPHTKNKPITNIISIADCLDASTDFFGRPYNNCKTYDAAVKEFKAMADTRYSSYVVNLLSNKKVSASIKKIITEERIHFCKEILTKK